MTIMTADCIGIELIGNRVYGGNGRLKVGLGKPEVERTNQFLPLGNNFEKVEPIILSIFKWQKMIQEPMWKKRLQLFIDSHIAWSFNNSLYIDQFVKL